MAIVCSSITPIKSSLCFISSCTFEASFSDFIIVSSSFTPYSSYALFNASIVSLWFSASLPAPKIANKERTLALASDALFPMFAVLVATSSVSSPNIENTEIAVLTKVMTEVNGLETIVAQRLRKLVVNALVAHEKADWAKVAAFVPTDIMLVTKELRCFALVFTFWEVVFAPVAAELTFSVVVFAAFDAVCLVVAPALAFRAAEFAFSDVVFPCLAVVFALTAAVSPSFAATPSFTSLFISSALEPVSP